MPTRPDDPYWVQVRCQFQCRECGANTPLDAPAVDGTVTCARCAKLQAYDVSAWTEGFRQAHAVGDLGGPDAGRREPAVSAERNPFAHIGEDATAAQMNVSGMVIDGGVMRTRSLELTASPGHPLCPSCHAPLSVAASASGDLEARCSRCDHRATYHTAPEVLALYDRLAGVLADDLRSDHPDARADESEGGGAIAFTCPNCSAALAITPSTRIATCSYCGTTCRIPSRVALNAFPDAAPTPWWILVEGASDQRFELAAPPAPAGADPSALVVESTPGRPLRLGGLIALLPLVILIVFGLAVHRDAIARWFHPPRAGHVHESATPHSH